ncbi:MAG: hypothetical protein KDC17_09035, partial [Actinobacteria bacterium]|nr:hypothetical protein [Actinomycetota bacterium]
MVFGGPAVAAWHTLRRPARIAGPRGLGDPPQVGTYRRAVSVVAAAFLETTADQRFGPAWPS